MMRMALMIKGVPDSRKQSLQERLKIKPKCFLRPGRVPGLVFLGGDLTLKYEYDKDYYQEIENYILVITFFICKSLYELDKR